MKAQNKDLKSLTIEELKARQKMMKFATGLMGSAILIMLASSIFLTIRKGFNGITLLPACFLPLMTIFVAQLKKIKDEIDSRV